MHTHVHGVYSPTALNVLKAANLPSLGKRSCLCPYPALVPLPMYCSCTCVPFRLLEAPYKWMLPEHQLGQRGLMPPQWLAQGHSDGDQVHTSLKHNTRHCRNKASHTQHPCCPSGWACRIYASRLPSGPPPAIPTFLPFFLLWLKCGVFAAQRSSA